MSKALEFKIGGPWPAWLTLPKRKVDTVFIHCSASDRPEHDDVSVMRAWHLQRGWSDVGYHLFIKKGGTAQLGRPWETVPAAQEGHNSGSLAICLHGLLEEKFTPAQFEMLRVVCDELNVEKQELSHGASRLRFRGHCEVAAKACPVFDYRRVLGLSSEGFLNPEATGAIVTSTPAFTTRQATAGILTVGDRGDAVKKLQLALNQRGEFLVVDGAFGKATEAAVRRLQRLLEVSDSGVATTEVLSSLKLSA
jgi:hypothetical protein